MDNAAARRRLEEILASLGYADPLDAARQHARLILLGRRARYEASIQQLAARQCCTLAELRARYEAEGSEEPAADDEYLEWQWYTDALRMVDEQLAALSRS